MKPKRRRRCSTGVLASDITLEALQKWFHLPSHEASARLGISLSVLKRVCREYGIPRWPYRVGRAPALMVEGQTFELLMKQSASPSPSQPPTPSHASPAAATAAASTSRNTSPVPAPPGPASPPLAEQGLRSLLAAAAMAAAGIAGPSGREPAVPGGSTAGSTAATAGCVSWGEERRWPAQAAHLQRGSDPASGMCGAASQANHPPGAEAGSTAGMVAATEAALPPCAGVLPTPPSQQQQQQQQGPQPRLLASAEPAAKLLQLMHNKAQLAQPGTAAVRPGGASAPAFAPAATSAFTPWKPQQPQQAQQPSKQAQAAPAAAPQGENSCPTWEQLSTAGRRCAHTIDTESNCSPTASEARAGGEMYTAALLQHAAHKCAQQVQQLAHSLRPAAVTTLHPVPAVQELALTKPQPRTQCGGSDPPKSAALTSLVAALRAATQQQLQQQQQQEEQERQGPRAQQPWPAGAQPAAVPPAVLLGAMLPHAGAQVQDTTCPAQLPWGLVPGSISGEGSVLEQRIRERMALIPQMERRARLIETWPSV